MTDSEIARALNQFPLGALCNAHPGVQAMHATIAPLFPGARLSGPAKTAKIKAGQNAAIHRAAHTAEPGDILVVDGGGNTDFGHFGDILATHCSNRGIGGLVIDGSIRDTGEIREMRFPVFCLGANPAAAGKTDPGDIDLEITCGGVRVRLGDFVVGDDDGVVVVPREIAYELISLANAVIHEEQKIKTRLAAAKTTCEVLGIDP